MSDINGYLLLGAVLLFASILASTLTARLGVPLLLLFLLVGMLAGEDGPGGVQFDDFSTAMLVGQLALAVILLDGGMRTRVAGFRVGLAPAAVLASWGVIASAALLGLFAAWVLEVSWVYGLLLGAIVGSTDAAAVFSMLRGGGVRLNERVGTTLEIESGINDPMAILLVAVLVDAQLQPGSGGAAHIAATLASQLGLGALGGLAGGWVLARLVDHLRLAEGLYALLIVSGGVTVFAATNVLGGSGFLAVYLLGLLVGNRRNQASDHVLRVMDGLAWLAQAGMFLVLGLLVTPSHLLEYLPQALLLALFLMLVARPLAVWSSLLPFRFAPREVAYIAWVGLRGAVPIVLAVYPVMMGVPDSRLLFDVTFAVVLVSLLVQGSTVALGARVLRVQVPPGDTPADRRELWVGQRASIELLEFCVQHGSVAEGESPDRLDAACAGARCVAVVRDGRPLAIDAELRLQAGDAVWYAAAAEVEAPLARRFAAPAADELLANAAYFGDYRIDPQAPAGALAAEYAIELAPGEAERSIGEVLRARLPGRPVVGDRASFGGVMLSVREVDASGRISAVGLLIPKTPAPRAGGSAQA